MIEQLSIWEDLIPFYKIEKPIRLIELFAGIGSQHQALKNLGVEINRSTICEWQVNSIQTYNDIHIRDYKDYSQGKDKDWLIDFLANKGVSIDYNSPMTKQQLSRKGESWLRNTYNNIIATNNIVNIMSAKGEDLDIINTNKYDYIMTYSFPCQDLSLAGKGGGMGRDGGTRSGLLWQVERLLKETKELPQILLMENVPEVIGMNNIKHFQEWELFLRQLGYSNYCEVLNAKDYGIPQNRNRAFMVSILGDWLYRFPQKQELKLRLKDMLETEVDENYYLSEREPIISFKSKDKRLPEMLDKIDFESEEPQSLDLYNRAVSNISQAITLPNHNSQAIAIPEATKQGYALAHDGDGVYLNRPHQKRGVVQEEMIQPQDRDYNTKGQPRAEQFETREDELANAVLTSARKNMIATYHNLRIRKLTPKECWRLMGQTDETFDLAQVHQSNSTLYHQAGDSIVVNVLEAILKPLIKERKGE